MFFETGSNGKLPSETMELIKRILILLSLIDQKVARHGVRYPGKGDTISMNSLLQHLHSHRGSLAPGFAWMGNWTNPFRIEDASLLTESGDSEHFWLGTRLAKYYGELFG